MCVFNLFVSIIETRDGKLDIDNLFVISIGNINALAVNVNGTYLCTASSDKSIKIFDVINFDMINVIKLDFEPKCAEWIHNFNDAIQALAV